MKKTTEGNARRNAASPSALQGDAPLVNIDALESVVRVLTRDPQSRARLNGALQNDPVFLAGAAAQVVGFGTMIFLVARSVSSGTLPPLLLVAASGLLGAAGARIAGSTVMRNVRVIEAQQATARPHRRGSSLSSQ